MRLLALAVALFSSAGCLEVDSPDGSLLCSTVPKRACPEGYYCLAADHTCWRYGHFPADLAEPIEILPNADLSMPLDLSLIGDSGAAPDDLSPTD